MCSTSCILAKSANFDKTFSLSSLEGTKTLSYTLHLEALPFYIWGVTRTQHCKRQGGYARLNNVIHVL